nr:hypothetical protein BJQ95_03206 [Cryobacterium sp. SO1]
MSQVRLSGQLVCRDRAQTAVALSLFRITSNERVRTREPGCISFSVASTVDPMVWQVDECFQDSSALKAHQDHVAGSDWGRVTAGIERRYAIHGL